MSKKSYREGGIHPGFWVMIFLTTFCGLLWDWSASHRSSKFDTSVQTMKVAPKHVEMTNNPHVDLLREKARRKSFQP